MPNPLMPTVDPAHNVLRTSVQPLDAIFAPNNVAVIGATEKAGSVGRTLVES
jgi:acetyltransferase